ncbi:MAG: cob(I)yrinic acid a,c-diamide adenosyltransferase [Flavobacteriales bacterium]|nr:cob(I)yrinic acid a,c-diamide adenosyltransferase [Flavobacteriales bacterium]
MKVYTKKGDQGETSLIGGIRVKKNNIRIQAYGDVDELNSFVGAIRDEQLPGNIESVIIQIQEDLFCIGAMLASPDPNSKMKIPFIQEDHIIALEEEIDEMEKELPAMKKFVLPGGNVSVSKSHIARGVCRRAERSVITLSETEKTNNLSIKYLNRLSDYLFVLSRKLTQDFGAKEIPWIPSF